MPPKKQIKNHLQLTLELPRLDNETRKAALRIVSSMINSKECTTACNLTAMKKKAFSLSKVWSSREPKPFPSNPEKLTALLEEEARDGEAVIGDANKIMNFYCPLLARLASPIDVQGWLAWVNFRDRIFSLGPRAWERCREKLVTTGLGIPVFLNGVSERLQRACFRNNEVVNALQELTRRGDPEASPQYSKACTERRRNVVEVNRCLSHIHLLYFLFEVGQWKGLEVAREFLAQKIGDREALECHCQALDVDALTSRSIVLDPENKPIKFVYQLDESELTPPETNQKEEEDEQVWWHWVEKWIRDFHCRGVRCQTQEFDELYRIVNRIDGRGLKTCRVIQALDDWRQSCLP